MRVLLDTNVVMDFLVERDGFDDAKRLLLQQLAKKCLNVF